MQRRLRGQLTARHGQGGFSLIERADGAAQWGYKGMPLYHWKGDSRPVDMNGNGIGGVWYVLKQGPVLLPTVLIPAWSGFRPRNRIIRICPVGATIPATGGADAFSRLSVGPTAPPGKPPPRALLGLPCPGGLRMQEGPLRHTPPIKSRPL
ncbi:hypothetical protein BYZ73_01730 [Rhodovulum viride]|uniref:Uncharacterized protein n=1 Tax=Rhodovulum viride TaxID=1231134 RepID=A0ABX9DMY3_9RHOB|nr:hypothetical protein [Rhodovulum viride]RAP42926.1 hypothetical protein BYZ73_01730 [Rhodovulum viride]